MAVVGIVLGAVMLLLPGSGRRDPSRDGTGVAVRSLPPYVEVIADEGQLVAELALARACEQIGRQDGRLYVVECTTMTPGG